MLKFLSKCSACDQSAGVVYTLSKNLECLEKIVKAKNPEDIQQEIQYLKDLKDLKEIKKEEKQFVSLLNSIALPTTSKLTTGQVALFQKECKEYLEKYKKNIQVTAQNFDSWASSGWYYRQMGAAAIVELTGAILSIQQLGLPPILTKNISCRICSAAMCISTISQLLNHKITACKTELEQERTLNKEYSKKHTCVENAERQEGQEGQEEKLAQQVNISIYKRITNIAWSTVQDLLLRLPKDLCKNNVLPILGLVSMLPVSFPINASSISLPFLLTAATTLGDMFMKLLEPIQEGAKALTDANAKYQAFWQNQKEDLKISIEEFCSTTPNRKENIEIRQQWLRDFCDSVCLLTAIIFSTHLLGIALIPLSISKYYSIAMLAPSLAWAIYRGFKFRKRPRSQHFIEFSQNLSNHFGNFMFNSSASALAIRLMFMFQAYIPASWMLWASLGLAQTFVIQATVITILLNLTLTIFITPLLTDHKNEVGIQVVSKFFAKSAEKILGQKNKTNQSRSQSRSQSLSQSLSQLYTSSWPSRSATS